MTTTTSPYSPNFKIPAFLQSSQRRPGGAVMPSNVQGGGEDDPRQAAMAPTTTTTTMTSTNAPTMSTLLGGHPVTGHEMNGMRQRFRLPMDVNRTGPIKFEKDLSGAGIETDPSKLYFRSFLTNSNPNGMTNQRSGTLKPATGGNTGGTVKHVPLQLGPNPGHLPGNGYRNPLKQPSPSQPSLVLAESGRSGQHPMSLYPTGLPSLSDVPVSPALFSPIIGTTFPQTPAYPGSQITSPIPVRVGSIPSVKPVTTAMGQLLVTGTGPPAVKPQTPLSFSFNVPGSAHSNTVMATAAGLTPHNFQQYGSSPVAVTPAGHGAFPLTIPINGNYPTPVGGIPPQISPPPPTTSTGTMTTSATSAMTTGPVANSRPVQVIPQAAHPLGGANPSPLFYTAPHTATARGIPSAGTTAAAMVVHSQLPRQSSHPTSLPSLTMIQSNHPLAVSDESFLINAQQQQPRQSVQVQGHSHSHLSGLARPSSTVLAPSAHRPYIHRPPLSHQLKRHGSIRSSHSLPPHLASDRPKSFGSGGHPRLPMPPGPSSSTAVSSFMNHPVHPLSSRSLSNASHHSRRFSSYKQETPLFVPPLPDNELSDFLESCWHEVCAELKKRYTQPRHHTNPDGTITELPSHKRIFIPKCIVWIAGSAGSMKSSLISNVLDHCSLPKAASININSLVAQLAKNSGGLKNVSTKAYYKDVMLNVLNGYRHRYGIVVTGFLHHEQHARVVDFLGKKLKELFSLIRFVLLFVKVNETTSIERQLSYRGSNGPMSIVEARQRPSLHTPSTLLYDRGEGSNLESVKEKESIEGKIGSIISSSSSSLSSNGSGAIKTVLDEVKEKHRRSQSVISQCVAVLKKSFSFQEVNGSGSPEDTKHSVVVQIQRQMNTKTIGMGGPRHYSVSGGSGISATGGGHRVSNGRYVPSHDTVTAAGGMGSSVPPSRSHRRMNGASASRGTSSSTAGASETDRFDYMMDPRYSHPQGPSESSLYNPYGWKYPQPGQAPPVPFHSGRSNGGGNNPHSFLNHDPGMIPRPLPYSAARGGHHHLNRIPSDPPPMINRTHSQPSRHSSSNPSLFWPR